MNKLLKLPLYLLAAGIINSLATYAVVGLMARGTTEWTPEMGTQAFVFQLILSVLLFLAVGLRIRKEYDRRTCFRAASIMAAYSVLALALEQLMQRFGSYSLLNDYLYVPIDMFTVITSIMGRLGSADRLSVAHAVPSLFAPYLFLLFTKRGRPGNSPEEAQTLRKETQ